MKVLLIGNHNSPLILEYARQLTKRIECVHLLDYGSNLFIDISGGEIKHTIYPKESLLNRIPKIRGLYRRSYCYQLLRKIPDHYDVCHMHFISILPARFLSLIQRIATRFVVSVFGSDFYRATEKARKQKRRVFVQACCITFSNTQTQMDFLDYYGQEFQPKTCIRLFGLSSLDRIKTLDKKSAHRDIQETLSLPPHDTIILCGTNASPNQNHEKIIHSIKEVQDRIPSSVLFLFPMTYGEDKDNQRKRVELELRDVSFNSYILTEFLSIQDLSRLRLASEILIQVQNKDQLSGAMMEQLFVGSIVITGDWLPYGVFDERGMIFWKVKTLKEIGPLLIQLLKEKHTWLTKTPTNRAIIWELANWEDNMEKWLSLYTQHKSE